MGERGGEAETDLAVETAEGRGGDGRRRRRRIEKGGNCRGGNGPNGHRLSVSLIVSMPTVNRLMDIL